MADKEMKRRARGKWRDGLQKRGDAWYCSFVDVDGKQKVKATGQPTIELARRFLADIKARVARGLQGVPEVTKEDRQKKAVTVTELLDRFLKEYNKPSIKDIKRYREGASAAINRRIKPYPIASKPVVEVRPADVEALRDALQAAGYSGSGINDAIKYLSTAISWGMDREIIPPLRSPTASVERMPTAPLEERYSLDEVHRLLCGAPDGLLPLVAFHLYTGCRPGEARGLHWAEVKLDAPVPYVEIKHSYATTPKTPGSRRLVPIHAELLPILRAWQGRCPQTPEGLVFPAPLRARGGGGPILGYRMARTYDDFGLPHLLRVLGCHVPKERSNTRGNPRERVWHTFRHTLSSALTEAGASGDAVSRILGHGGRGAGAATMTLSYTHVNLSYLAGELGKISFTPPAVAGVTDLNQARRKTVRPRNDPARNGVG